MKKALAALLSMTMVLGFTGCTGENNGDTIFDTAFSAKDAIKIEDIDWNVTESVKYFKERLKTYVNSPVDLNLFSISRKRYLYQLMDCITR